MSNERDCPHGRQVGKCADCDVDRLEAENEALKAEIIEQARLSGMGSEREARVLALNSELVAALIEIEWSNNTEWQRDRAKAALAKAGVNK